MLKHKTLLSFNNIDNTAMSLFNYLYTPLISEKCVETIF